MRRQKLFYIKERDNPQLGTYFMKCGPMSKTAAKEYERGSLYGSNVMHSFSTEEEYLKAISKLEDAGEKVQ